ncbi:hypothetical protein GOP47_0021854 [Adiantum capillus-veneris]|uniref:Uncharacterized protein n=1 Tax=Adiantum capillus-veneris TaxID=13818 RepID=A0A9D4Z7B6_ADICA|nr:hypothetical protein GOP47_0021854 [Adiantum capillus-veneris]
MPPTKLSQGDSYTFVSSSLVPQSLPLKTIPRHKVWQRTTEEDTPIQPTDTGPGMAADHNKLAAHYAGDHSQRPQEIVESKSLSTTKAAEEMMNEAFNQLGFYKPDEASTERHPGRPREIFPDIKSNGKDGNHLSEDAAPKKDTKSSLAKWLKLSSDSAKAD